MPRGLAMSNPFNNPYQEEQYWRYAQTQYVSRGECEALVLFSHIRAMEDPALASRTISSSALAQRSVDRLFENAIAIKEKQQSVQQRIAVMEAQQPIVAAQLQGEFRTFQTRFDQPAHARGSDARTPRPVSGESIATRPRPMMEAAAEAAAFARERREQQHPRSRSPHRVRNGDL